MNQTNGNTDHSDQPGDPVKTMLQGSDGHKLAGARKALKKKLLKVLLQQTIDEINPDNIAEEAFESGLITQSQLGPLVAKVRAGVVSKIAQQAVESGPDALSDDVVAAIGQPDLFEEASTAVSKRLLAEIGETALAKMGDPDVTIQTTFDSLAEANDELISDMAESVRERLVNSMVNRAMDVIKDEDHVVELADLVSARLKDDMVTRIVDETRTLSEETLVKLADERLDSTKLTTSAAADRLRSRFVDAVVSDADARMADAEAISVDAWELISDRDALVAEPSLLLKERLLALIADEACKQLGSTKNAAEIAESMAREQSKVIDKAIRLVYDGVARTVAESVGSKLEDADALAEASSDYVDLKDPQIAEAVEQLRVRLSERLATRVVSMLSGEDGIERLSTETETAHAETLQAAETAVQEAVMAHIINQVGRSFLDAGDTARRAKERLGASNATIIAAGEVLKELVLEDLAKQATIGIMDAATAAEKAFDRIDTTDPRFVRATETLREQLISSVAERSLKSLEESDQVATEARERIPNGHEHLIGASAVLRELLVDEIARRSEEALRDTRKVAEQSHGRVPSDSPIIADASERLRLLLIEDMVSMTTDAMADAQALAEDAMRHVNNEDEALMRARSVFKERVLVNVLGEAIREINSSMAPGNSDSQNALFHQTLNKMTQSAPGAMPTPKAAGLAFAVTPAFESAPEPAPAPAPAPSEARGPKLTPKAPDRPALVSTAAPLPTMPRPGPVAHEPAPGTAAAQPIRTERPKRPSLTVDEPPSWDDQVPSVVPQPVAPPSAAKAPGNGWVKLSDMDSDERYVPLDPPELVDNPIETEIFEADDSERDTFAWDFDLLEDSTDEDTDTADETHADDPVAQSKGESKTKSVDMTWDADDGTRCYVYGYVSAVDVPNGMPPKTEGIDSAHPVKLITVRDLRAVVSKVAAEPFTGRNAPDPSWVKQKVRTHARVLDTLKPSATVIPVKFGTVWDNEASIAEMLSQRYDDLTASLERLRDKKEWGIRVTRNVDRLRARLLKSGRAVEDSLDSISAGVAQFVKDELSKAGELDEEALTETVTAHCLRRAHHALEQWSVEGVRKPLMDQPGTDLVMNAAYLVETSAIQDFRGQLDRLTSDFEGLGFAFDLSGPWPPYHFVGEETSPESELATVLT